MFVFVHDVRGNIIELIRWLGSQISTSKIGSNLKALSSQTGKVGCPVAPATGRCTSLAHLRHQHHPAMPALALQLHQLEGCA
jgi:hypothetical protein